MSASEFEGYEAIVTELQAGTLDAPDHLHRRVLALGTKRPRAAMSRRRKLVLVVPVAATLAVGAALVHGAFFAGSKVPFQATERVPGTLGPATFAQGRVPPARRHALVGAQTGDKALGTPNTTASYSAVGSAAFVSHGDALEALVPQKQAVAIPKGRLVHADASLQVVVPSHAALSRATNKASQIVSSLGGYAQSVQYQASRAGDGNAFLDLRVPVGKAETAIGQLGGLGRLVSQQVSTQDLQQQLNAQTGTIGSLKRAIAIYEQALSSGSLSGSNRVEVQIRLSDAEHSLAVERKARIRTVASGATADIQLTLTTNQHAFAVGHHKSGRVGRLLGNAGHFLALEGVIVLYALIVAGPIVLILALAWWLRRERRRRDERQLLAST